MTCAAYIVQISFSFILSHKSVRFMHDWHCQRLSANWPTTTW